jgi:urocanate hydratase
MGVIRHADAGYQLAQDTAKAYDLDLNDKLNKQVKSF